MKSPPHTREFRNWAPEGVDAFPAIRAEFGHVMCLAPRRGHQKTWEMARLGCGGALASPCTPALLHSSPADIYTMLSALLAADRDVARLDRGTTRRENVPDASPAC